MMIVLGSGEWGRLYLLSAFAVLPLAVVVAIAVPAYQDYAARLMVSGEIAQAGAIKLAVSEHYLYHGQFPVDGAAAGLTDDNMQGFYSQSEVVEDGEIVIRFPISNPGLSEGLSGGGTVVLSPSVDNGQVVWTCSSPDLAPRHLPADCR